MRVQVVPKAPHVKSQSAHGGTRRSVVPRQLPGLGTPGCSKPLRNGDEMLEAAHAVADDQRGVWATMLTLDDSNIAHMAGHAPGNVMVRVCCLCRKADRRQRPRNTDRRPARLRIREHIRFWAGVSWAARLAPPVSRVLRSFDRYCLEHGAVRLERGVVVYGSPIGRRESRGCRS